MTNEVLLGFSALLLALLAWALGLLTPQIVERISRQYRRPELLRSIALELDELRFRLVATRCNIHLDRGELTKELAAWVSARAKEYNGVLAKDATWQILVDYGNYSEPQLVKENALSKKMTGGTTSLKQIGMPFLKSQLSSLSILPIDVQRQLLEILTRIGHYNSSAERIDQCHAMTFDTSLDTENRKIINQNIRVAQDSLDSSAEQIVELADSLIPAMIRGR